MDIKLTRTFVAGLLGAASAALLAGCTIYASEGSGEGRGDEGLWESRGHAHSATATGNGAAASGGPMRVMVSEGRFPQLEGQEVIVHLRRDALGAGGAGPVAGLNVDGPNRSAFSVAGTYRGQDGDWAMIQEADGRMIYVPLDAILAVETAAAPTP